MNILIIRTLLDDPDVILDSCVTSFSISVHSDYTYIKHDDEKVSVTKATGPFVATLINKKFVGTLKFGMMKFPW